MRYSETASPHVRNAYLALRRSLIHQMRKALALPDTAEDQQVLRQYQDSITERMRLAQQVAECERQLAELDKAMDTPPSLSHWELEKR